MAAAGETSRGRGQGAEPLGGRRIGGDGCCRLLLPPLWNLLTPAFHHACCHLLYRTATLRLAGCPRWRRSARASSPTTQTLTSGAHHTPRAQGAGWGAAVMRKSVERHTVDVVERIDALPPREEAFTPLHRHARIPPHLHLPLLRPALTRCGLREHSVLIFVLHQPCTTCLVQPLAPVVSLSFHAQAVDDKHAQPWLPSIITPAPRHLTPAHLNPSHPCTALPAETACPSMCTGYG